jgi:hypothetical protein
MRKFVLGVLFFLVTFCAHSQDDTFQSLLAEGTYVTSVEATGPISVSYNTPFFQVVFMLPITREVTVNDGSTYTSTITWNEGTYDETVAGAYPITGTLSLPAGVYNPNSVNATVTVTVEIALSPSALANQIIWLRENNTNTGGQVDNWNNKFNSSLDLVKLTDARRPNLNSTGIEGSLPTYEFTLANSDLLKSEGTTIGLSGDFTYYIIFKDTDPTNATAQILMHNASTDLAFVNTGLMSQIRGGEIWDDFRKNVSGSTNQQRVIFPFTSTAWHIMHVKHDANGAGNSTNVVKLDGALIKKNVGMEPVVHNSNPLKIGSTSIDLSTPFGGSIAEVLMTSDYHSALTEASVLDYFKTRYPTEMSDIEFFDETKFRAIDNVSKAWNGLDTIPRVDGKYDLIGGTLTGEIYYMAQGATINDWTTTLLISTGEEIQHIKVYGEDSSGKLIILSLHKDATTVNDNVGKIMVHRENVAGDHDGAWSSLTLVTGRGYPQSVIVRDIYNNDGVDEFIYAYEGNLAGQGGVRWYDCSNVDDALNAAVWTEHTAITHEGAWWLAGFYNIGGTDRLVFSARNATSRNPAEVPGIYYLTMASPVTNTWTETTIDNTVADWLHVDVGNFFGNSVDIVAVNQTTDEIYAYNSASSFAKSTIITGVSTGVNTMVKIVPGNIINGRNSFMSFTENDWCYLNYYNGSTWSRRKLLQTLGHPPDSQLFGIDVDNSGFQTIIFDDNTNLANANVFMLRL